MDLKTTYLGLELSSPLVVSASPLSEKVDNVKRMEDAGAAGVVLHSLFEEQLEQEARTIDHYLRSGSESYAESTSFFPHEPDYRLGPHEYLEHIHRSKEAVKIPVMGSLNGSSPGGWTRYAKQIEQAGADALELNIYHVPADLETTGPEVEQLYIDVVKSVRDHVNLPLAVKVSPFFSATGNMARRLVEAGADGLVLFNRFYQPDIDLEELEVKPNVLLSTPQAMRLPLRWIAILHGRLKASLAGTGGIHTHEDVLKMIMAGADVTMLCSALLRHGVDQLRLVKNGMQEWMEAHEYASIAQMKGSVSQRACPRPAEFERANYMRALTGYHLTG